MSCRMRLVNQLMSGSESPYAARNASPPGGVPALRRAGGTLGTAVIVAVSLLTFPGAVPWMVAAWLLWHTLLAVRGRPGWMPLAVCVAILLVKRVYCPPGLVALGIVMLAVGLARGLWFRRQGGGWHRRVARVGVLGLWAAWAVMALDWHLSARCGRTPPLDAARPVVCLGDSLTAYGYPDHLDAIVSVPVVNLGRDGITTGDALADLQSILEADPQVVVIELGGHDFLKGKSRAATKRNLETLINACRKAGAEVVLMEILRGVVTDRYASLERELARQYDLELISDTPLRELVLFSPYAPPGMFLDRRRHLSDDGLHPNERGNGLLAGQVACALERIYGPRVRTAGRADSANENGT